MGGTLIKLKEFQESFTKNEKKISHYLLENIDEIKVLNTYDLAVKCDVSQASVVRFAKKLGFKGYPDFKLSLSQDIGNRKAESNINIMHEEIKANDSFEVVGKKISHENITAINNTYEIIDFKQMDMAVKAIAKAQKIMVVGVGFSSIAAKDLYYKLLELGKTAVMEMDTHTQLSCLSSMGEKDLLFVISHSGKTIEMYNITRVAKEKGIKIISMTSIVPNPISELATIKLNTVEMKGNFRSTALSPRISQLTVIDMLYVKLMLENKSMQEYIFNAIDLVKGLKLK